MFKPSCLEVAVAAARRAGEIQLAGLQHPIKVCSTSAHDVKLQIDLECEQAIRGIIRNAFPDHAVLAEEGGGAIAKDVPTWIVDPLDGTVNYSRRIPFFCTSIAVQEAGEVVLGVIYTPIFDELYVVEKGKGAYLNNTRIHVSDVDKLSDAIIAVGCGKAESSVLSSVNMIDNLATTARKIRILGAAALDIAYVAAGRLDGYFECGLRTWDIAAATLLLREACGRAEIAPAGEHAWDVRVDNGNIW